MTGVGEAEGFAAPVAGAVVVFEDDVGDDAGFDVETAVPAFGFTIDAGSVLAFWPLALYVTGAGEAEGFVAPAAGAVVAFGAETAENPGCDATTTVPTVMTDGAGEAPTFCPAAL